MPRYYTSDKDLERFMKRMHKKYDREKELERKMDQASVLMELAESRFKNNVPLVDKEPSLEEYDLPENAKELIDASRNDIDLRKKRKDKIIETIALIVAISSGIYFFYKIVIAYDFILACSGAFFGGAIVHGIILFISIIIFPDKKTAIKYEEQYNKFEEDTLAYNYWQTKKTISYWDSLDGHAFERNVADIFRKHGYDARVSREGGDGGIDIVLTKENERIAVQCKAHNKAVAPAVARDLYGTMVAGGFKKGMIVSKNGFTKGVFSFVRDKNIELVDLNDIINMAKSVQ